ncbi:hypothetical protein [Luteimonas aquatica]|uniref:hypothetical protein n=1 Tax=Luteimonas aquatica TaxID=450364 RepID=UPI001F57C0EB|nr:hypothetical protein [Luteimonas aquatica]
MFIKSKLFLAALAVLAAIPANAEIRFPGLYRSVAEKTLEIPISYGWTTSPERRVIYSVGPLNLIYDRSNFVDVSFQAGLTKRCAGTVRVGYYVVRTNSPTGTDGFFVTRYAVVDLPERPSSPENLPLETDEGINHSISQASSYQYKYGDPLVQKAYFNVVMFANSYDSSCIGQTLQLKGNDAHDYHGELVVKNY